VLTGPRGRITKEDLHAYVKAAAGQKLFQLQHVVLRQVLVCQRFQIKTFSKISVEIEVVKMSKIQRLNCSKIWFPSNALLCLRYAVDKADITDLEASVRLERRDGEARY